MLKICKFVEEDYTCELSILIERTITSLHLYCRDEVTGQVDHNVLRHLNIEKDSEQYKKFEYPNPSGLTEKLQKNIENLQTMPTLNEAVHMPSLEEKANIREKMFSFLDESRMEETRLVRLACV